MARYGNGSAARRYNQNLPAVIRNSAGKIIRLNRAEERIANSIQRHVNALGYEISVTTLTTIVKKISEQKFFTVAPADYLPVRVGEGSWSQALTTYRAFDLGGKFADGVINTGGQNARQAVADTAVDSVTVPVFNWAKSIGWSIFDLEQAAKSGNWDIVSSKEKARKKNWDLGIQEVAFLGLEGNNSSSGNCFGLLNQAGANINTSVITKAISSMTTAELKAFTVAVVEAYRSNNNRTAYPTHFIIPESDYNGLAATVSPDFPIKSILELLIEMFRTVTMKPGFKILPLAYADAAYHTGASTIVGKQVYTLLNYDEESIRMDIPLDYTNTLANSFDNFNFQNTGYGQFTGVGLYRPLELLYFQY